MDISAEFNFSRTIQQQRIIGLYSAGKGQGPKNTENIDKDGEDAFSLGDVVDLGNSRHVLAGRETILTILEEKVNARIEAHFKDQPVEKAASTDEFSPENTAKRIVNFALHFYDTYSKKNGGESEANLTKFLDMVKGAIGEGIGQAETIIGKISGGDVPEHNKSVIQQTRDSIEALLEEFRTSALARLTGSKPADNSVGQNDSQPADVQGEQTATLQH